MMRFFKYELKKNLMPMLILSAICVAFNVIVFLTSSNRTNTFSSLSWTACVLCVVVPVIIFSFKMSRRSLDAIYSMPITREKVYLTKAVIGLILILVPYTLSYAVYAIATAIDSLEMVYAVNDVVGATPTGDDSLQSTIDNIVFLRAYFIYLIAIIALYALNSFAFTSANTLGDGITYMVFYSSALAVLVWTFGDYGADGSFWFAYSPMTIISVMFDRFLHLGTLSQNYIVQSIPSLCVYSVLGIACAVMLIKINAHIPAERTGQISDNIIGYKVFIPYYVAFLIGNIDAWSFFYLYFIVCVMGLIGYFAYRRTFRIKLCDIISLVGAIIAGVLIQLIF